MLYAQMPTGGHYFWDVFPGLILSGMGWRCRSCQ